MLPIPARSDKNATCLPSGDQTGLDGWRISMSVSIVNGRAPTDCSDAARGANAQTRTRQSTAPSVRNFFIKTRRKISASIPDDRDPTLRTVVRFNDFLFSRLRTHGRSLIDSHLHFRHDRSIGRGICPDAAFVYVPTSGEVHETTVQVHRPARRHRRRSAGDGSGPNGKYSRQNDRRSGRRHAGRGGHDQQPGAGRGHDDRRHRRRRRLSLSVTRVRHLHRQSRAQWLCHHRPRKHRRPRRADDAGGTGDEDRLGRRNDHRHRCVADGRYHERERRRQPERAADSVDAGRTRHLGTRRIQSAEPADHAAGRRRHVGRSAGHLHARAARRAARTRST